MSSFEQSTERGSDVGVEGIARLDVLLRQNELEWRHITDAIAVNVVVQRPTGTCLFANRTALDFWGLKLEDVMVANYRAPVHPDDAAQMLARRQEGLAKGLAFENELRSRRSDGEYRWFLWRYVPVHDEQGQVLRWYVTGTDIDDRKRAEDRMRNETLALRDATRPRFDVRGDRRRRLGDCWATDTKVLLTVSFRVVHPLGGKSRPVSISTKPNACEHSYVPQ